MGSARNHSSMSEITTSSITGVANLVIAKRAKLTCLVHMPQAQLDASRMTCMLALPPIFFLKKMMDNPLRPGEVQLVVWIDI